MKMVRRYVPPLVLLAVSVLMVVYGAVTQTFPAITIPASGPAVVTSNCSNLVQHDSPTALDGAIGFDCGSGTAAFTVTTAGTSTPTFAPSPTSGSTLLRIFPAPMPSTGCTPFPRGVFSITSGSASSLATGSYDYCLGYASVAASGGSIPSFTVSWT